MTLLVAVTDAVVVDVTGADRLRHLEDVTTQHVTELRPGARSAALVLDPHGVPLAAFDVVVEDERVRLVAPTAEVAAHLTATIGTRTFLADAAYRTSTDRVVALRGDAVAIEPVLASAGLAGAADIVRADGRDVLVGVGDADRLIAVVLEAGGREVGSDELDDLRVRAGRPAWGVELTAPHLPEESGVLATHVHLAKGCYPGQEAVARMWMLGRPRRRLAHVVAVDSGTLAAGTAGGEGRERIEVTSATRDGREALAYVPATAGVGDRLGLDGDVAAEVVAFVGDGLDVPGHDPRQRRRRDVDRSGAPERPRPPLGRRAE